MYLGILFVGKERKNTTIFLMTKINFVLIICIMLAVLPTYGQHEITLELRRPAIVGMSIPVKFKRFKNGKLKRIKDKSITVKTSFGSYENKKLVLPYNVDNLQNHQVKVSYSWSDRPSVWYDTLLNVGYSGKVVAFFGGHNGQDGDKGGSSFLVSLFGRNGADGGDGADGSNGKSGEDVDVFLDAYYDSLLNLNLLRARVVSKISSKKRTYLVNTTNGEILVSTKGGNGGHGGKGGNGGDGKNAKAPTKKKSAKSPGYGGNGGDGGNGANGADGGMINVFVKPSAKQYMHLIRFNNKAGRNGNDGECGLPGSGGNGGYGYGDGADGHEGDYGHSGIRGTKGPNPSIVWLDDE
jgi:hypothetical protein